MSFCDKIENNKQCSNADCCGNRVSDRGSCSEARIFSCNCQSNVGCLDCGGLRPVETAACPGICQCVEEKIWNSNAPPKPNCRWLNNFAELRRQWSDYGRQQTCKCCNCNRFRTVASGRLCLSPTPPCSGTILTASVCQKCCKSRRLAGGASKSEMALENKSSPLERSLKRETGGGCPSCYPSTNRSCNADCSSTSSPSQCKYSLSSRQAPDCQSCNSPTALKSIWKKRNCQCNTSYCLCQPMSRDCNCPLPVQIDVRAARECSCDCSSKPECACPPSERRFPKTMVTCPNTRPCCPFPRLPPAPNCARCQSCPPSVCHPCTSIKCRDQPIPPNNSCCPRLPTTCLQPASVASSSHPPTPRKKLTFCIERSSRPSSPCKGTGQFLRDCISDNRNSENNIHNEGNDIKKREKYDVKDCDCCCAADCTESENGFEHVEESYDLTLNERSELKNFTSNVLINSSEITKPSKSVDPDSLDMPRKRNKSALENTKI